MDHVQFKPWQKLNIVGDSPLVRQGHAVAVVQDRAYFFGGSAVSDDSSNIYFDDLYCIKLGDLHDAIWELIEQSGDIPNGREGHSLNVVGTDLYLLGGVESDGAITSAQDHLYILNTDTHCWSTKKMSGDVPNAQSSTCVTTNDGRLIKFGGVLTGMACNDTHVMDIATLVWTCPETTGTKPSSRCDHGCVVVDTRMYVFGGSGGESLWFNDLSYLDLETWQWVVVLHSIVDAPCPRDYPSLLAVHNKALQLLIVFGGFTGHDGQEACLSDTHCLCYSSNSTWYPVTTDGTQPRGRYGHVAFVHDTKIYIQGGQNSEKMFNDLWMLETVLPDVSFSPTITPRTSYNTLTPIPTPRKKLPPTTVAEISERNFHDLRDQYLQQISELFDTLSQKFQELDEMTATLKAERKQFELEREELHDTYDKQQQELQTLIDSHQHDNEEWVESIRKENDQERRAIAEEKAKLAKEREELENEREKFNNKSTKLDEIMRQVQGLK